MAEEFNEPERAPIDRKRYARVQCISGLRPWANVVSDAPGPAEKGTLRPLALDEVAVIVRADAEILKKNRHAVEVM